MRPKSEIYTPKRDAEHPLPFQLGDPPLQFPDRRLEKRAGFNTGTGRRRKSGLYFAWPVRVNHSSVQQSSFTVFTAYGSDLYTVLFFICKEMISIEEHQV